MRATIEMHGILRSPAAAILALLHVQTGALFATDVCDPKGLQSCQTILCLEQPSSQETWRNPRKLEELLRKGLDPNQTDPVAGEPLLIVAAREGRSEVISLLLDYGAELDIENNLKCTAVIEAANLARVEAVVTLLHRGASADRGLLCAGFDVRKGVGKYGNHIAPRLIADALEGRTLGSGTSDGWTQLHWACSPGLHDCKRIIDLLAGGADPNSQTVYGFTPLMAAVQSTCECAVETLLLVGADANATEYVSGESVLQIASLHSSSARIIDCLLSAGADVGYRNKAHIGVPYRAQWNKSIEAEEIRERISAAMIDRAAMVKPELLRNGRHSVELIETTEDRGILSGTIYVYYADTDFVGHLVMKQGKRETQCQPIRYRAGTVGGIGFRCSTEGFSLGNLVLVLRPDASIADGEFGLHGIYGKEIKLGVIAL